MPHFLGLIPVICLIYLNTRIYRAMKTIKTNLNNNKKKTNIEIKGQHLVQKVAILPSLQLLFSRLALIYHFRIRIGQKEAAAAEEGLHPVLHLDSDGDHVLCVPQSSDHHQVSCHRVEIRKNMQCNQCKMLCINHKMLKFSR